MKRRLAVALFSAFAIAAFVAPAAQAASVGPATKITNFSPARTTSAPAGQFHAVAVNPKTGAQIALYYANDGGYYLGAQRFNAQGPVGSEHVVATSATYAQNYWQYGIAYNPTTGGWLAAYPDYDGNQIIGQLLKADGSNSGAPFTIGTIASPAYGGIEINWNSKAKKFLVSFSSYYDTVVNARFVTGGGSVSGAQFTAISGLDGGDYLPMDAAYSSKSNTFLVEAYGNNDDAERPKVQLVSGSGSLVGASRYLGGASWDGDYAASVAYNAKRDEFGVMWYGKPDSLSTNYYLYLQRIKASNGTNIGNPVQVTPPGGMDPCCYRPWLSVSPAGQYYLSTYLSQGTSSNPGDWYSFKVSDTGETIANSFENIGNGVGDVNRPQTLYNPKTCEFVTTFVASASGDYNLYANGSGPAPSCPQAGSKPSLKKKGTPGATSLKVKVGCAGGGSCRMKLSGKLIGGSGKLKGKKVKVKGKSTVTLDYTDTLISELAADGGGKIKVKAKQVGGGSRTITVVVPSSVTG